MQLCDKRLRRYHGYLGLKLMSARVKGRNLNSRLETPEIILSIHPASATGRDKAILMNGKELGRVKSANEAKRAIWLVAHGIEKAARIR